MNKKLLLGLFLTIFLALAIGTGIIWHNYQDRSQQEKAEVEGLPELSGKFGNIRIDKKSNGIPASIVFLNQQSIMSNDLAGFSLIYPNKSRPEIIIMKSDCGGSACGTPAYKLIDVQSKLPFVSDTISILRPDLKIERTGDGMYSINATSSLTNSLGDNIAVTLIYDHNKHNLHFVNTVNPTANYASFIGQHPDTLLADQNARKLFLNRMSAEDFKLLRYYLAGPGSIDAAEHERFITASGMAPHMGGDPAAFFIIDQLQDRFIAGLYASGKVDLFTNTDDMSGFNDGHILSNFLERYGYSWDGRINFSKDGLIKQSSQN